jgi:arylsulfatase A-like enzyme
MRVPAFLPDAPAVRQDLARFYDLMTAADYQVGDVLAWLDQHRLAENTVVMVFGDHGIGLPRMKRWVYDSSLQVDLVVRWPGRIDPGTVREDLVAFVDFAPTVLSIAGVTVPDRMQGQVFLGPQRAPAREYVYGARDRFDNAFDRIRSVRDSRYHYIRNYHPEIPYSQKIPYAELGPTLQTWRRLAEGGGLTGPPALFFVARKPPEELYDTAADRDEVRNLAADPSHRATLDRLRAALDRWTAETTDLGAVPEADLVARGILRPGVQ